MTLREWLQRLLYRPRPVPRPTRVQRDVDEQQRLREVWLRLERVGREIQATAARESER